MGFVASKDGVGATDRRIGANEIDTSTEGITNRISAPLRLIDGGLHRETSFGHLRIVAAPENAAPFEVEAIAFEEDTWLVMSADPKICEPQEHPIRLMTDLIETQPEPVGSVLIQDSQPLHPSSCNRASAVSNQ